MQSYPVEFCSEHNLLFNKGLLQEQPLWGTSVPRFPAFPLVRPTEIKAHSWPRAG